MFMFKKETVSAKIYQIFWLLVGLGGTLGGFDKLRTDGVASFIPWTVFLIGVAIAVMATAGPLAQLQYSPKTNE